MKRADFRIGQIVYIRKETSFHKISVTPVIVQNVGRKYVTVLFRNAGLWQYAIETGLERQNCGGYSEKLYLTKEEIFDEWEADEIKKALRRALENKPFGIETARKVAAAMGISVNMPDDLKGAKEELERKLAEMTMNGEG